MYVCTHRAGQFFKLFRPISVSLDVEGNLFFVWGGGNGEGLGRDRQKRRNMLDRLNNVDEVNRTDKME